VRVPGNWLLAVGNAADRISGLWDDVQQRDEGEVALGKPRVGDLQAGFIDGYPLDPQYIEVEWTRSPTFVADSPVFPLNPEQFLQ
jgi:hypothetical protein